MPIFKIQNNKVIQLKTFNFRNEEDLRNLLDPNLEEIFGIRFIAPEVPTDSGRMDTL